MVYAIKYEDKYLRISQFHVAKLMDHPETATLYLGPQLKTAKRHKDQTYWIDGKPVDGNFQIVELEFSFTEKAIGKRPGRHNKPRKGR